MVVKSAEPYLMKTERKVLELMRDHTCIRQKIDDVESPPSMVLEYFDDNLLDVCSRKRLIGSDVKMVARSVLEALAILHEAGFVHTGK